MRPDMHRNLIIYCLGDGLVRTQSGKNAGLIFHSDRGSQYASDDFAKVLEHCTNHALDEPQGQPLGQRLQ